MNVLNTTELYTVQKQTLWDVHYISVKTTTTTNGHCIMRKQGGHKVNILQMLGLTSDLAGHRMLAPKGCVLGHDFGREEQTSSYSITGAGRKAWLGAPPPSHR